MKLGNYSVNLGRVPDKKLFSIWAQVLGYNFHLYLDTLKQEEKEAPGYTIHKELDELWLAYDGDIVASVPIKQIKWGIRECLLGRTVVLNKYTSIMKKAGRFAWYFLKSILIVYPFNSNMYKV